MSLDILFVLILNSETFLKSLFNNAICEIIYEKNLKFGTQVIIIITIYIMLTNLIFFKSANINRIFYFLTTYI